MSSKTNYSNQIFDLRKTIQKNNFNYQQFSNILWRYIDSHIQFIEYGYHHRRNRDRIRGSINTIKGDVTVLADTMDSMTIMYLKSIQYIDNSGNF